MKKSVMTRMVCLIVAALVLSGSLMAAALTGSPYETLKDSVLDAMMIKNGSVKAEVTLSYDGVAQETSKYEGAFSETASYSKNFDADGNETGASYSAGNLLISKDYLAPDGTQWYYSYMATEGSRIGARTAPFGIGDLTEEKRNSATMRFAELAIDALVGDLKNNITMSQQGDTRHISGTLTGSQIPALASAGLDMLVEQGGGYYSGENTLSIDVAAGTRMIEQATIINMQKNVEIYEQTFKPMTEDARNQLNTTGYNGAYYGSFFYPTSPHPNGGYEITEESQEYMITSVKLLSQEQSDATRADFEGYEPLNMPLRSMDVSYLHGEADVDAAGNLTSVSLNGTALVTNVFGESFTLDLRFSMSISDIGTAVVSSPIPDAEQVLTRDFLRDKIGNDTGGFYFKLNADGSIDRSSVTTTYPGENRAVTSEVYISSADPEVAEPMPDDEYEDDTAEAVVDPEDNTDL